MLKQQQKNADEAKMPWSARALRKENPKMFLNSIHFSDLAFIQESVYVCIYAMECWERT